MTGMKEQSEEVNPYFPMIITALDPKPTKYSSSTLRTFTGKIKKGSQKFRALLTREDDFMDEARIYVWWTTLHNEHIDKKQVSKAFKATSCKRKDQR